MLYNVRSRRNNIIEKTALNVRRKPSEKKKNKWAAFDLDQFDGEGKEKAEKRAQKDKE